MDELKKELSKTDKIRDIELTLIQLDARFKERWDNHDKRSDEKWDTIHKELGKIDKTLDRIAPDMFAIKLSISDKLGALDCTRHLAEINWLKKAIVGAYGFATVILLAIITGLIK